MKDKGFTLLEILVALSALSILTTVFYVVIHFIVKVW
jgi:prepilin-type N-terminal cleavage/methylation domain-containing protein